MGPRLSDLGYEVVLKSEIRNPLFRLFDMLFAVMKFRKRNPVVLIDTYSTKAFWFASSAGWLCRLLNLRYIPILRGGNLPHRIDTSPTTSRKLFKHAKYNVAVSDYLADAFTKRGLPTKVIHNFVDLSSYPFRQRKQPRPAILWVRAFHEIYNPQLAIRVFHRIASRYKQAEFCMVGPDKDGSMNSCIELAKSLGIQVRFTGKLEKTQWISLANDYDIFLNTTNVDNTPVSVMEAMAMGMPVVTTNAGGIPFLFQNGTEGIITPVGDEDKLVEAIEFLLSDSDLAGKISAAARQKASEWDWKVISEKWKTLLNEA